MKMKRCLSLVLSAVTAFTVAASCPVAAEADQKETVYTENEEVTEPLKNAGAVLEELPENDELFEGYVNELFYGSYGIETFGNFAEGKLEGNDAVAYGILKENIKKVASGELSDSRFLIPFQAFGVPAEGYSASDLGIASIMENGQISEAAKNALAKKISVNLRNVLDYLLADCPYEFYWFDKTAGVGQSSYRMSATSQTIKLVGEGITYSFSVADEYRDKDAAEPAYTVKSALAQSAKTAADNAKAIVSKYEGYSDYDKLDNYRKEICDLVEYNTPAAEDKETPYGNPWQLIWVFDGDESTNVVCEGYSKAFQYLCDMSDFFSPNLKCYTVTGVMVGGTGAGGHMWNIVTMDDQKNYIVDVTNCDGNSIGNPDKLFLAGAVYKENIVDGAGTSHGDGYEVAIKGQGEIEYVYDDSVEKMYGDGILTIADTKFSYDYIESGRFDSGIEWTLDKYGFLNIKGSGDMPVPTDVTDTTNAPWSEFRDQITRVVVEQGITSVSNWAFAYVGELSEIILPEGLRTIGMTAFAGSKIKKLKLPESVERIDPLAFAYCGSLTEIEIPENVTEIGAGAFLDCGSLTAFTVNPSNSSFVFENGILYDKNKTTVNFCTKKTGREITLPNTVTSINYYGFNGCDSLVRITIPDSVKNIYEEAFANCTSLREVCFLGECPEFHDTEASGDSPASSVFSGDNLTIFYPKDKEASWAARQEEGFAGAESVIFKASCETHEWAEEFTVDRPATCIQAGLKSKHCKVCGMIGETAEIPAGHNYGEWETVKPQTCTESGQQKRVCGTCKEEQTQEIAAAGHTWDSEFTIDKEPACTAPGSKSKHCGVCGEKDPETVTEIPAKAHSLTKKTEDGVEYYLCGECHKTFRDADGNEEFTITKKDNKIPVERITVSAISTKIAAGKKVTLETGVFPANASNRKLIWESNNPAYATVSADGIVTTKKAGKGKTVTITVKAADGSGKSASITIKLMKDVVKKVKILKAQKRLKAGRSLRLKAQITGSGKKLNKSVKWISSNEKYATVSSNGVVKANSAGKGRKVKITAMATDGSNKKATVKIKIN